MSISSKDLHPIKGARFVFTKTDENALSYVIEVFLPEGKKIESQLEWEDGKLRLTPEVEEEGLAQEIRKLAKVLARKKLPRMIRWREL